MDGIPKSPKLSFSSIVGVVDAPPEVEEPPREVAVKAVYIIIAGKDCPGCEEIQEEFAKEIKNGDMTVVSVQDDKGIEIVMKLGLYALPVVVAESVEGDYVMVT
jgi:hypothetical protein